MVQAERAKLAGADLSSVDEAFRAGLRAAFRDAYIAAFRVVMLVCAALATVGAVVAGALVQGKREGAPAKGEVEGSKMR